MVDNKTTDPRKQLRSGWMTDFLDRCSSNAKALILIGAMGGGGLSVGLLFDDIMGMPQRVEANTQAIIAQDSSHMAIMNGAATVTETFRDSILAVQGDILRTLRAWVCFESARFENRSTAHCGLQQLLPG